ncbi:MAG: hypothetical protein K1Y02_12270 [Candidatus Hydrogenedentes bacterium]|nr:hypothetical protein [Candidatus Hydrogenedentota bacterium]
MRILRQLAGSVRSQWHDLPLSDRYRCMVVGCLAPMALYLAIAAGQRPGSLEPLATGLSASETQAMSNYLLAQEVPYELRDGGQAIWVPAGTSAELKIELTQFASRWLSAPATRLLSSGGAAETVQGSAIPRTTSDLTVTAQEHGHGMTYGDAP